MPLPDIGQATTHWLIDRWDADQTAWVQHKSGLQTPDAALFHQLGVQPYNSTDHLGNAVLSAGWLRILTLAIAGGGTAYDATHSRIGVGDGATAVTTADTTLTGATNKYFKLVSGAPTVGVGAGPPTRTLTFAATFGTGVANFVWAKFGIDQGTADGATETATLLNAAVSAQGTKAAGQTWSATAIVSFT